MSGFELARSSSPELVMRKYASDAAARKISIGDAVKLTGTAAADGTPQVTTLAADTAGSITGVVVGVVPDYTYENFSSTGVAASAAADLIVCDDPRALYEIECYGTLAITDVGSNACIYYSATTSSGVLYTSNLKLDNTTGGGSALATTATLPLQVVKLLKGATSGVLGDRALVRINASTVAPGATGV